MTVPLREQIETLEWFAAQINYFAAFPEQLPRLRAAAETLRGLEQAAGLPSETNVLPVKWPTPPAEVSSTADDPQPPAEKWPGGRVFSSFTVVTPPSSGDPDGLVAEIDEHRRSRHLMPLHAWNAGCEVYLQRARDEIARLEREATSVHGELVRRGEQIAEYLQMWHEGRERIAVLEAELAEARKDAERFARAILWALGYDMGSPDFLPPADHKPRYWWRALLESRAGGHAVLAAAIDAAARHGGISAP